jgi:membrane fusion protein, multidrug efflux system
MLFNRFKISFLGLGLFLVFQSSCQSKTESKKEGNNGPVGIDVSIAKLEVHANPIEANGSVLANEYVQLRPEVAGRIIYLNIEEGKYVFKGDLLAKLNDTELQAQLNKQKAQLALAEKNEKRLKSLLDINGLNQADYDQALEQVNNLKADIDYTKAMINKTEVKAPFNGTLGLRNVSFGAYVSPQDILASIQQLESLKVDFVLPEVYASSIHKGKNVKVIADNGNEYDATVVAIEPQINTATRNVKIRAIIKGNRLNINPGAFVRVVFDEGEAKQRILINSNCVIPDTRFMKVAKVSNGKIDFVKVETGFRTDSKVEILSGLNVGDTFAINGILFLKPGSEVKIQNIK